jgi:hypothetical protein
MELSVGESFTAEFLNFIAVNYQNCIKAVNLCAVFPDLIGNLGKKVIEFKMIVAEIPAFAGKTAVRLIVT